MFRTKWDKENEENCIMCSTLVPTFTKCYWHDQIEEDEVGGGVWRMGAMRYVNKSLVGKPEGKIPIEDLGTEGRIRLKRVLGM
jgi:hypothetical protein